MTVSQSIARIAADIGGTFTDLAVLRADGRLATRKLASTPANYADAVIEGIVGLLGDLGSPVSALEEVLHGCTVATNAILEHKGARTALLTTKGFRDVLELRRIRVPQLYDPLYEKPAPLVPRNLRFEVSERLDHTGAVITPLSIDDVARAATEMRRQGVEAVAVCFLHSYANPAHERQAREILQRELPDRFITLSLDVLPQKREYERTSTTVINAYVGPPVQRYVQSMLDQLAASGVRGRLMVMQSSGGIFDAASVLAKPALITECGPAAGVLAAEHVARLAGYDNVITLDMGGTTAKASIIEGGRPTYADEYEVGGGMSSRSVLAGGGGYALKLPVIDISEVGAGGGSIAWLDKAGSLKVGPESGGAVPGPACYGVGNQQATVTDANVVLGYLNPLALAGGTVPMQADLARRAVAEHIAGPLGRDLLETAYGIHIVANVNMMKAVKAVTTYRGRDPRAYSLLAFGGSGGMHAVDLARVLLIGRVILPMAAGVFSAVGLLFSKLEVNETAPFLHRAGTLPLDEAERTCQTLRDRIVGIIGGKASAITFQRQADLRFVGQAFELTVSWPDGPLDRAAIAELCRRFEAAHLARYGHAFSGEFPVELVNLRLVGSRRPEGVGEQANRSLYPGATGEPRKFHLGNPSHRLCRHRCRTFRRADPDGTQPVPSCAPFARIAQAAKMEDAMADPIVFPGTVEWSGENPGISLKDTPDGPFVALASFFRVVLSPHGRGHALVLLQSPQEASPPAERGNFCLHDNAPLARYLVADFVSHFGTFRGLAGLGNLTYRPLDGVEASGDPASSYSETVRSGDLTVRLTWSGLGQPFCFVLPPDKSATGKHHMPSLFVGCQNATITVNGRALPGKPVPREIAGHTITTAMLAFSETWIRS